MRRSFFEQAISKSHLHCARFALHGVRISDFFGLLFRALVWGGLSQVLPRMARHESSVGVLTEILWPISAVAVVMLWGLPYRQWMIFLTMSFLSMILLGALQPSFSIANDSALALLSIVEASFYALAGRWAISQNGEVLTVSKLARFMVVVPLLANIVSAAVEATLVDAVMNVPWLRAWQRAVASNGVAMVTILPALLTWSSAPVAQRGRAARKQWVALALAGTVILLILLLPAFQEIPEVIFRALLMLALTWTAIQLGVRSTLSGVAIAALGCAWLTSAGVSPYRHAGVDNAWALQLDLAMWAVFSSFMALAVHQRSSRNIHSGDDHFSDATRLVMHHKVHDLNNVLGRIAACSEIIALRDERFNGDQEKLEKILEAVDEAKDLVAQIVFAFPGVKAEAQLVDLRDLCSDIFILIQPRLPSQIQLSISVPSEPMWVPGHQQKLVHGIFSVLLHAIAAANSKVTLVLAASRTRTHESRPSYAYQPADILLGEPPLTDCACIDVIADGKDLPGNHIQQLRNATLCSPAEDLRCRPEEGLAILAEVVADCSGCLAVWIEHDERTRFRLELPWAPSCGNGQRTSLADEPPSLFGHARAAMIIAKDPSLSEYAEELLAKLGYASEKHNLADFGATVLTVPLDHAQLLLWIDPEDGSSDQLFVTLKQRAPALGLIRCSSPTKAGEITCEAGVVHAPWPMNFSMLRQVVKLAAKRSDLLTRAMPSPFAHTATP